MTNVNFRVPFRRKRIGKTDYRKRRKMVSSKIPRIVIRPSNRNILIQLVEYAHTGDTVRLTVSSQGVSKKFGWKFSKSNTPAAYLTGLLAGKQIAKKGVKSAVLDIQASSKGSKVYAALKGVIDAGVNVPHDKTMIPSEDRIAGKAIEKYSKESKSQFSGYAKLKVDPGTMSQSFDQTKKKILT